MHTAVSNMMIQRHTNQGIWIAAITILVLFGAFIALGNDYPILTKLKSYFIVLLSIDHWKNVLIYVLVLYSSIMLIEVGVIGWGKSSIRRLVHPSKSTQTDIVLLLLRIFRITPLLSIILSFGFLSLIHNSLPTLPSIKISTYIDNHFLEGVVWFLVFDFMRYFSHYLLHRIEFLWESHKFHHSATEFNILTNRRSHPISSVFSKTSSLIVLTLLGLPMHTVPFILIIHHSINIINHSNLPWRYGWVGRWFIYSPHGHRIHHSIDSAHIDKNFGSILPIWDRIFGTWAEETKAAELIEIGLLENDYNKHNFIYDYWLCTLNTMRAFWNMMSRKNSGITQSSLKQCKVKENN